MAPSFDQIVSSLLCPEDNTSIFDEFDNTSTNNNHNNNDDFEIISSNYYWENDNLRDFYNKDCNFLVIERWNFSGFFVVSDEFLASMFEKESNYFVGIDYLKRLRSGDLDLDGRNQAIDWILKVQSHYKFGPLCAYLAVNYLDRFLSAYELPKGKMWMMQLLAVACLSLATKVDETHVPLSIDLQVGETKFIFEAKTIQRMELLVLSTLNWRMQSVTPFSFIDYFLYKLGGDERPPKSLIFQAIRLIISTIKVIELLEFKPSEIAVGVAFYVTQETQLVEQLTHKDFSFLFDHVQKERVKKCIEIMEDIRKNNNRCNEASGGETSISVPQSPMGVLDIACLSYKSDETSTTSLSFPNSPYSSSPKRRKLDNSIGPTN